MPYTYFISDLHLHSERPGLTRAFANFLDDRTHADALYILGDLFDTWIGDDDTSPLAAGVKSLLARFSAAGPTLYLMHGNRDFLLGEAFCAASGAILLQDPCVVDLYGRATLICHGDTLCTADAEYQAFRKNVRNDAWQREFLTKSLSERRSIAAQVRNVGSAALAKKHEEIVDVSPQAVADLLQAHRLKQLIHGHTHRPGYHKMGTNERWVLGDWGREFHYLQASAAENKIILCDINHTVM